MKSTYQLSALFLACSLALAGCGGGGSSSSGSSTPTSSSSNPSPASSAVGTSTGTLVDSAVSGVTYTTTSGVQGTTDASGHFTYNTGDNITFKVGSLTLGTVSASNLITPIDLSNSNFNIQNNLLVLLQSLDSDNNPSNGITITPAVANQLAASLDLTTSPSVFATNLHTLMPSITIVPLATAQANFQTALSTTTSPTSTSSPLQLAKDFVNTSNAMISSANTVFTTYQPANLVNTSELTKAVDAIGHVTQNAYIQSAGSAMTFSTAQLQTLLSTPSSSFPFTDQFTNLNNLSVSTTASGTININGTFNIAPFARANCSVTAPCTPTYGTPYTVTVKNLTVQTTGFNSGVYGFTLNSGSGFSVTTAAGTSTLTAGSNSSISINYPTAGTLQNKVSSAQLPDSGSISLQNISLVSGGTTIALNQLGVTASKVQYEIGSGPITTGFIPTELDFSGTVTQGQSNANVVAQVQLPNFSANTIYNVNNIGNNNFPTASDGPINFNLAVNTNIVTGTTTNTFKAQFTGNLTYPSAQSAFQITVNNNKLTGSLNYTAANATTPASLAALLNDPNGASLSIPNVQNFTSANIVVNNAIQGKITKTSGSVYQALFNDNSIIVIAP
ncbi:MAG: hypothetical protein KGO49_07640 [Gammaproteobacteria bacterium]|nr:hypothetical protein [Gammaproteobacteria bacterium]